MRKIYFLVNEKISEGKLRVINSAGENLGVLSREDALAKAQEEGQDLVLISKKATPPVAKILDFSKFLFQKRQQEKRAKKRRSSEVKELRLRPNIDENDLTTRIERAKDFLKEKHRVLFTVRFLGREISHPEVGKQKIDRIIEELGNLCEIEKEPWFEKKRLMLLIKPK